MTGIIIVVIVLLVAWYFLKGRRKSKATEVEESPATERLARTPEQKNCIKYFTASGCLAGLSKMKDSEYDALVERKLAQYGDMQTALQKLCIDESMVNEVKPMFIHGYDYADSRYIRLGKDDKWRASDYQLTWVFCGGDQVYFYSMTFSLTNGNTVETTDEYFYQDITNFEHTTSIVERLWKKKGCISGYERKPVVADSFRLSAMGVSRTCAMESGAETEQKIQGLKAKLREKKNA